MWFARRDRHRDDLHRAAAEREVGVGLIDSPRALALSSRSRAALRSSIGRKVSIARFAAVTSSGAPRVAITVKRLTSPSGVRRSSETTGWVAGLVGGSSGR